MAMRGWMRGFLMPRGVMLQDMRRHGICREGASLVAGEEDSASCPRRSGEQPPRDAVPPDDGGAPDHEPVPCRTRVLVAGVAPGLPFHPGCLDAGPGQGGAQGNPDPAASREARSLVGRSSGVPFHGEVRHDGRFFPPATVSEAHGPLRSVVAAEPQKAVRRRGFRRWHREVGAAGFAAPDLRQQGRMGFVPRAMAARFQPGWGRGHGDRQRRWSGWWRASGDAGPASEQDRPHEVRRWPEQAGCPFRLSSDAVGTGRARRHAEGFRAGFRSGIAICGRVEAPAPSATGSAADPERVSLDRHRAWRGANG